MTPEIGVIVEKRLKERQATRLGVFRSPRKWRPVALPVFLPSANQCAPAGHCCGRNRCQASPASRNFSAAGRQPPGERVRAPLVTQRSTCADENAATARLPKTGYPAWRNSAKPATSAEQGAGRREEG